MSATADALSTPEPWPPHPPDISWKDMVCGDTGYQEISFRYLGYVYNYQGLAYKPFCMQKEYDMMKKAGNCAVTAVARVMMQLDDNRTVMKGLLMELETPFKVADVAKCDRAAVKDEMIQLVSTLHETYRMVHGDIKPNNMLRCRDGKLRLCDFDTARFVDEDPQLWEGLATEAYLAPNRDYFNTGAAPTPSDDIYALGLSIWELYTGKPPLSDEIHNIEEVLKERRTVNLMEVEDPETRWLIRLFLRQGGALV